MTSKPCLKMYSAITRSSVMCEIAFMMCVVVNGGSLLRKMFSNADLISYEFVSNVM